MSDSSPQPKRALSLGVIFLTLYIDLIGFSIIFPLGPDLIEHYLKVDGQTGILGWMLAGSYSIARRLGQDHAFAAVLFGGAMTFIYSIFQFVFSPIWGSLSDRHGRRPVLLVTVTLTAVGYLIWAVSGSFWIFLLSRVVSGAFSGNLSVVTAAVADVTTRQERSKAMGLVGAAFGLGLITGPAIGGISAAVNLLNRHPSLARIGINPFTVPAVLALLFCLANLVWVWRRFNETLPPESRSQVRETRLRNPLRAILMLDNAAVRRANIVAFVFSTAFVAMEASITFLSAERFGYTAAGNTRLLVFMGAVSIFTQGYVVRKMLKRMEEIRVLAIGLVLSVVGLAAIGLAGLPWVMYAGLAVLATGSGFVNPSTSGLISLYAEPSEQGKVLGIFRSLGSLSRAVTPLVAGLVFWASGSRTVFIAAAAMSAAALLLVTRLPKPVK